MSSIPSPLAVCGDGGQAEVPNLDLHVVVEEQVAQLQVSMDDVACVQVLWCARV